MRTTNVILEVYAGQAPVQEHWAATMAETTAEFVVYKATESADRHHADALDNLGIIAADSCRHRGIEISGWEPDGRELTYFPRVD